MSQSKLKELRRCYRVTFGSEEGQRVLEDLRGRFHADTTTFVPGDPHQSAFLEGQRDAVLTIARMLIEEPDKR